MPELRCSDKIAHKFFACFKKRVLTLGVTTGMRLKAAIKDHAEARDL